MYIGLYIYEATIYLIHLYKMHLNFMLGGVFAAGCVYPPTYWECITLVYQYTLSLMGTVNMRAAKDTAW